LKVAYFISKKSLPQYSHHKSPHIYSFPQLIACNLLKIYIRNIPFRDLEELMNASWELRNAIGLEFVPDHSTFHRAQRKISDEQIQKLFDETIEIFKKFLNFFQRLIFGFLTSCDSTGFREDSASFYYAKRSGKKRKRWIKPVYMVETRYKFCLSQVIKRGPSQDSRFLEEVEGKAPVKPIIEITDMGFDGRGNFGLRIPFRIIPPIRRGGRIKSFPRKFQRFVFLLAKFFGIYQKRWLCETQNSVIKRKFTDSIRERGETEKMKISSLMAIVYNIHVIVRYARDSGNGFYFFVCVRFICR
jgi:hypothetical protein